MYKKITHHIVEEHFGHPGAHQIKAMSENTSEHKLPGHLQHLKAVNMQTVFSFRTAARTALSKYFWRVRSSLVSILDNAADQAALQAQLYNDIANLGTSVAIYYGPTAGTALDSKLKMYSDSLIDVVKAIRDGKDYAALRTANSNSITDLATFLSSANPTHWPASAVTSIFAELSSRFIEQAVARKAKDWLADFAAVDKAQQIFMTNPTSFADVFVNGIVSQFPDKFTS